MHTLENLLSAKRKSSIVVFVWITKSQKRKWSVYYMCSHNPCSAYIHITQTYMNPCSHLDTLQHRKHMAPQSTETPTLGSESKHTESTGEWNGTVCQTHWFLRWVRCLASMAWLCRKTCSLGGSQLVGIMKCPISWRRGFERSLS